MDGAEQEDVAVGSDVPGGSAPVVLFNSAVPPYRERMWFKFQKALDDSGLSWQIHLSTIKWTAGRRLPLKRGCFSSHDVGVSNIKYAGWMEDSPSGWFSFRDEEELRQPPEPQRSVATLQGEPSSRVEPWRLPRTWTGELERVRNRKKKRMAWKNFQKWYMLNFLFSDRWENFSHVSSNIGHIDAPWAICSWYNWGEYKWIIVWVSHWEREKKGFSHFLNQPKPSLLLLIASQRAWCWWHC